MNARAGIEIWYHQIYDDVTPSIHIRMQLWDDVSQTGLSLTEFIVNSINIYVFNLVYYENLFHN